MPTGWTKRVFHESLQASLLPEIEDELLGPGIFFPNVVSVFPSVSIASHLSLLTGVNQNTHGIPGHRWLDKTTQARRDYIGPSVYTVNKDIHPGANTIFEKYSSTYSIAIQSIIQRGAKKSVLLHSTRASKILSYTADAVTQSPNSITVAWLPRGDILSHIYGPDSSAVVNEMVETSKAIGVLIKRLKVAGLLATSRILFTSDHGLRTVNQTFNLSNPFRLRGYSSKVNPRQPKSIDVPVYTSGDSAAFIYSNTPFRDELGYDFLQELVQYPGVGLAFFRFRERAHWVFSKKGVSLISEKEKGLVDYKVLSGDDPLELSPANASTDLAIGTLNERLEDQKYPDILYQYIHSYVPTRSADVLVTSEDGYHFGQAPRLGWRLGYHRGTHGGPSQQEMLFSAIATGFEKRRSVRSIRLTNLLDTLLEE